MSVVHIRRQGGAAIMTIPADVMRKLDVSIGATVELEVAGGAMVVRPARVGLRRYSLLELLDGVTPARAREMARQSAAWHRGPSAGRELP
jgi:antitoxin ChpS